MPVEPGILLGFLAAAVLLVVSPGPDTMLILRYTIGSGQRTGLATVAGVQAGLALHTLAAVVGLSLLIAATPWALRAIAAAGAAYLAWLGWQSFRAGVVPLERVGAARVGAAKAFRDALLTNLLNPKVVLLFLALMPQFVTVGASPVPLQLAFLGLALIAVNSVWQAALALAADFVRRWLGRPSVQRAVSWATGAVLMLFALLLAAEYLA